MRSFPGPVVVLHRYAAAVLLTAALAIPAGAADRIADVPPTSATNAVLNNIKIDNFGRVDAHLYRGAQPEGRDFADLKALGIKTVVNLTSDDADPAEKAMAESVGLRYLQIPMTTRTVPTDQQLATFLAVVDDAQNGPVYVHCVGGRHRTGVMTAVYRMSREGWTADRAFSEMKQYKFGADFLHPEFKNFVYTYHPQAVPAAIAATASVRPADAAALSNVH